MPLIDLKTNLKSLKFGNDQPGGGSSGLPYIQTGIPRDPLILRNPAIQGLRGEFLPIYRPGSTGGSDFPIRGGAIEFSIGSQTFTLSSQIDKTRIRRFFEDKARGTIFLQKQIGLQLSNPKIETGNSLYSLAQTTPLPGLLENTRIYNNGINTLAQVGVSGTGAHAVRHGTLPFNPLQKNYYSIVDAQNVNNESATNRLLILQSLKMTTGDGPIVNTANVPDINRVNTLGISLNRNLLFQYLGGPGSVYGIGNTTIKRAVDTTRLRSSNAMNYDELLSQESNRQDINGKVTYKLKDFRSTTQGFGWTNSPDTVDKRFYVSAGSYKDKMNLLYPFVFKNNTAPWELNNTGTDDLIKFVFEAISNDDPSFSMALFFRAFLTAGINDNNSAQLNAFKYMGRGENFYTYQGFDRTIGFSFRVAAGSRDEIKPLYNKVNALMSQVYPDYSPNQGIMRAPIVRVTIGDYLYRVPGFLESVNITIDNNYPWEVNLEKSQIGDIAQLPQVLDIAISFKPIMDILPRRVPNTQPDVSPELADADYQPNLIPKLIVTDPSSNIINPFLFETAPASSVKSAAPSNIQFQNSFSDGDSDINANFTAENTPAYKPKPLSFTPRGVVNRFESQFEKDIRTGNLFEFRTRQIQSGTGLNVIGTAETPSYLR